MVTYYQTVATTLLSLKDINQVVGATQKAAKCALSDVSVHMIGDRRMTTMNTQYRGKAYATDVLSFPTEDTDDIGDIFICVPQIIRQSKKFGVTAKEECTRMLVHGVLHLLGYDHQTKHDADKMFSIQEKVVKKYQ
jgi:probable rRNA maturation factor